MTQKRYVKYTDKDMADYSNLIFGKEYEIIREQDSRYIIKNEYGKEADYFTYRFSAPYIDPKDLEITKLKNQIIKLESAMLELKKSKTQEEIERKYKVQLYPNVVGFHLSVINWYEKTGRLSTKQVDRLKNPMFKIPGISL